jgi:hypothetical protein
VRVARNEYVLRGLYSCRLVMSKLCRVGTEPSAVAPGQTQSSGVFVVFDPALPRSVLCFANIQYSSRDYWMHD